MTQRYWFRAKSYGWGWSLPLTWEGWVVFGAFLVVAIVAPFVASSTPVGVAIVVAAGLVLVGVCWWKGEPARWRWGRRP